MKVSASVYANPLLPLAERIALLERASADMLHIDCKNDLNVFSDIDFIQKQTSLPIDLHLIATDIPLFLPEIIKRKIAFCSLQFENLSEIPTVNHYKDTVFGIAVKTTTALDFLPEIVQKGYQYVMLMCTTPGESGGVFEKINFQRIHSIKAQFPTLKIQIDGGVDNEIAFILRLMGIDSFVSGSYLMGGSSVSEQMLTFFKPSPSHDFVISDFMLPLASLPILCESDYSFYTALEKIDQYKQGFVLITTKDGQLKGVIANADSRKAILRKMEDVQHISLQEVINKNCIKINQNATVYQMWQLIQDLPFIILFLPVINDENKLTGAILLNNLTRG